MSNSQMYYILHTTHISQKDLVFGCQPSIDLKSTSSPPGPLQQAPCAAPDDGLSKLQATWGHFRPSFVKKRQE